MKRVGTILTGLMIIGTMFSYGNDNKLESRKDFSYTDGKTYDECIQLGIQNDSNKEYHKAISYFTRALEIRPNSSEAYDMRGVTNTKLLKYTRAIKDLTKAIELNPDEYEYYNHRAIAYYCIRNFELALEDYAEAIQLNPSYSKAYYNRGLLNLALGQNESAYIDLKTAMELDHPKAAQAIKEFCVVK